MQLKAYSTTNEVFLPKTLKAEFNQDFGPNYQFTGKTGDGETC